MGRRPLGHPRYRWKEEVAKDMKEQNVLKWLELAQDRKIHFGSLRQRSSKYNVFKSNFPSLFNFHASVMFLTLYLGHTGGAAITNVRAITAFAPSVRSCLLTAIVTQCTILTEFDFLL